MAEIGGFQTFICYSCNNITKTQIQISRQNLISVYCSIYKNQMMFQHGLTVSKAYSKLD